MNTQIFNGDPITYLKDHPWIALIMAWTIVWKLIAMWKSARNNHLAVFLIFTVLNTLGIGEIIYLTYIYLVAKNKIPSLSTLLQKIKNRS